MANQTIVSTIGKPLTLGKATSMTRMQSMASIMWAPWLIMGFMIVLASLIIGAVNGAITADYFDASKPVREAAGSGSSLADKRVFIETIKIWLPAFKFLGMGMLLGGITFALATILGNLRKGGSQVQQALDKGIVVLETPLTGKIFPMLMMMGVMILVVALGIGIWLATVAAGYWDHSIATELNLAPVGSALLDDLGTINSVQAWLASLKFVGIAFLLSGITLALATIVQVLRFQTNRMLDLLR